MYLHNTHSAMYTISCLLEKKARTFGLLFCNKLSKRRIPVGLRPRGQSIGRYSARITVDYFFCAGTDNTYLSGYSLNPNVQIRNDMQLRSSASTYLQFMICQAIFWQLLIDFQSIVKKTFKLMQGFYDTCARAVTRTTREGGYFPV